ncbi:MAG: 30S ribosomal protein S12 methylthiotransferase RimO [Synergistaceae bacterium]|jgi:ribosomal protein S12 methylthiotransferase|nr:30S ribosomal protein S12 methylthiotransferase RimO [Synergistaceae bacterium]
MSNSKPTRVFCLTLGCSKNTVDSERIIKALAGLGFEAAASAEDADVAIVNTCGFIRSAVEENIAAILDLVELKTKGNLRGVGVVGCLVARFGDELKRDIPEVDFWAGCEDTATILAAMTPGGAAVLPASGRVQASGELRHVRYLKISEGCDKACSYCAIPSIRGPLRSRTVGDLVAEAESLAHEGAAEICLVAQDLSAYGEDRGERGGLIPLLDALESSLPGDVWLRMLYLQPSGVGRALLERVANGRQVLPYLDIPIQHSVPRILNLMNRGGGADDMLEIFETARAIRPDFALRTTCMVGFPGETRSDFASLLKFLEKVAFDRLGAFIFSPEEGTVAADLPSQTSKRTARSRLDRLMSLQENISYERNSLFVGREMLVTIDEIRADGSADCRSYREAPDVDGVVGLISLPGGAKPGDKIRVRITDAYEHDLEAEVVEAVSRSA